MSIDCQGQNQWSRSLEWLFWNMCVQPLENICSSIFEV